MSKTGQIAWRVHIVDRVPLDFVWAECKPLDALCIIPKCDELEDANCTTLEADMCATRDISGCGGRPHPQVARLCWRKGVEGRSAQGARRAAAPVGRPSVGQTSSALENNPLTAVRLTVAHRSTGGASLVERSETLDNEVDKGEEEHGSLGPLVGSTKFYHSWYSSVNLRPRNMGIWKPLPNEYMVIDPSELYVNVPWTPFMTPVMHWGDGPMSGQSSVYRGGRLQILTIAVHLHYVPSRTARGQEWSRGRRARELTNTGKLRAKVLILEGDEEDVDEVGLHDARNQIIVNVVCHWAEEAIQMRRLIKVAVDTPAI
ncbi:hypothetical protein EDB86DRAFT_2833408 [Lactarius hatsudake]|nr:hypothetical protein EDB86DRAFT_2833408 [Lactarius hatsudake]